MTLPTRDTLWLIYGKHILKFQTDEAGVLKPEHIDPETNYRLYTTEQIIVIHLIQCYRQIGLSISEKRAAERKRGSVRSNQQN